MEERETPTAIEDIKMPKNTKGIRYYYRHREEILAKRVEKLMEDPEYRAKKEAKEKAKEEAQRKKEEARIAREEAKRKKEEARIAKEEERERRRLEKAKKSGAIPSG